jgi:iron(III) transport system substrate-binding protein
MDAQPSERALSGRAAVLALLCGLLAATSAFAQGTNATLAEIAAYSGPDRIAKLLAGAKKEGAVNIYTSETVEDIGALSQTFEAKYGVKLNIWRGSSEDILQRAVGSRAGDRDVGGLIDLSGRGGHDPSS